MKKLLVALALFASLFVPATASATTLAVRWSSLPSPIYRGLYETATVVATPKAVCGIVVKYSSTISHATGLVNHTVPSTGKVVWKWKIGSTTHPGSWRVTVTCKLGTQIKAIWKTLTIKSR